jgi:DNA-binding LytR/AlgR family response regulator
MNLLIVEDVTLIAERIAGLASKYFPSSNIDIVYDIETAKEKIEATIYDLLLLDLNLNGENGFDLISNLTSSSFETIIITADKNKAAMAFDFAVLDFITKPIKESRFELAAQRYLNLHYPHRDKLKYLSIKLAGKINLVAIDSITYIKASGNYSEINTIDGQHFLYDKPLEKLENILPESFKRIHRSYIVGQSNINNIQTHGGGKYSIEINNAAIPMSRSFYLKNIK